MITPEIESEVGFKRMVTHGFLLWQHVPDEDRHILVGIVDCTSGGSHESFTDQEEADHFYATGKVFNPVFQVKKTKTK